MRVYAIVRTTPWDANLKLVHKVYQSKKAALKDLSKMISKDPDASSAYTIERVKFREKD